MNQQRQEFNGKNNKEYIKIFEIVKERLQKNY
jgi:hypothetical protein